MRKTLGSRRISSRRAWFNASRYVMMAMLGSAFAGSTFDVRCPGSDVQGPMFEVSALAALASRPAKQNAETLAFGEAAQKRSRCKAARRSRGTHRRWVQAYSTYVAASGEAGQRGR